ncbi:pilus assembly protein, partial [Pseudomonas fluorescens]
MRALMLDFQPRRRASPLGWSLLAGGVVLVLSCIVIQQHLSEETEQQQGHLQT